MAVKGGDLLHVGDRVLIERAQTAGPGQVTLAAEKVYELGNYQSIATIYDIPDLSFTVDSLDASAALEAMLCGKTIVGAAAGTKYDLAAALPLDVVSQFKKGRSDAAPYEIEGSVAITYLTLESVSYRFGLKDKAQQTATLKGDSIYYNPGSAYMQSATGTNVINQQIVLAHNAYPYNGAVIDGTKYALGVKLRSGKRLAFGTDYTETVTGAGAAKFVKVVILEALATNEIVDIVYNSDTVATYLQAAHTAPTAVRPAAIRGRDIEVFLDGTSLADRWTSVQSVQVDWQVTLEKDEEFSNTQAVSQDFDVPVVNGNIVIKPRDYADLFEKVSQTAGSATLNESAGAITTVTMPLTFVLHSPDDGSVLKTLHIPDARINVPGYQGQVQQKLQVTFNFESDTGVLEIYHGAKP